MKAISLYTDAQWEWCKTKWREGYTIREIADFLGVHRQTVHRRFVADGIIVPDRYSLPPLKDYADEFNRLIQEDAE